MLERNTGIAQEYALLWREEKVKLSFVLTPKNFTRAIIEKAQLEIIESRKAIIAPKTLPPKKTKIIPNKSFTIEEEILTDELKSTVSVLGGNGKYPLNGCRAVLKNNTIVNWID